MGLNVLGYSIGVMLCLLGHFYLTQKNHKELLPAQILHQLNYYYYNNSNNKHFNYFELSSTSRHFLITFHLLLITDIFSINIQ